MVKVEMCRRGGAPCLSLKRQKEVDDAVFAAQVGRSVLKRSAEFPDSPGGRKSGKATERTGRGVRWRKL